MKNWIYYRALNHAFSTVVISITIHGIALAGVTDIAPVPIFTATTAATEVKPNVMFVLDDSGSMDWDYMPDDAKSFSGKYGFPSSQCNGVYYNPIITYTPPVTAAGVSYPYATFAAAWIDGYDTALGTKNLSTSFKANSNDTSQSAYYYTYSGTQKTEAERDFYNVNSIFYKECISSIGSALGSAVFTKVVVGTSEQVNFANWYSYYRTRMQMMKTASGLAFSKINEHFRVGFMSINNNASPAFLNISDFDTNQKTNWYSKLYASSPNNSTPLREALANAGGIYAGKISTLNGTTITNPVQYSCQQNYTILSTDGFWNGTSSAVKKLDRSTVMDNQDGTLPRPYNDGASSTTTTVTPYVSTQDRRVVTTGATITNVWSKVTTTVGGTCTTTGTPPNLILVAPTSALDDGNNSHLLGLGTTVSSNNPDSNRCIAIGASNSTIHPWFCRGSSTNKPVSPIRNPSVTDANGVTWYLVSSTSGNTSAANCVSAQSIDNNYPSSTPLVCPGGTSISGKLVTVTPYTQTELVSGSTSTTTTLYTATQTTTQITTNGVAGPLGALTPTTPTYSLTSVLGTTTTSATSDTCGGQPAPCPSEAGTWVAGTPTKNNVCTATAALPVAGTTAATQQSSITTGGIVGAYTVVGSTGPTAGTPIITGTATGGTSNTLADTAAYYYNTNLRTTALGNCTGPVIAPATTATDLCTPNKVPPNGLDTATWQHMTTFTLGLGARGRMIFSPTYLSDTSGDYFDVAKGNSASSTRCTWAATGTACNWPTPGADKEENIDDLWHAAVNGHGSYFSARDPATLQSALASSLNVIINTPQPGTAAAAATTNPKITSANNFQFSSYFKSLEWSGELIKQTMSTVDGSVPAYDPMNPVATTYDWSAQARLDAKDATTRAIYTKGSTGLIPFNWSSLVASSLDGYFRAPNISTSPPAYPSQITGLSQFCSSGTACISTDAQTNYTIATNGAGGEALVNYLRGDRSNEDGVVTDPAKFYRHRTHVLGDIVSAQPQYVGPPNKSYADTDYAAYKVSQATRDAVVYAAANDGMLHAFNAANGEENWAYIPSFVLPKLFTLADKNYSNKHQYFVEGTPRTSDVYINGAWKTILVGGLNGGGTGYYALDVTNPTTPVLLWEFTDANMGYTFGNPEITKLDNGTWVVIVTSGYNNCPRTSSLNCVTTAGNGNGYLYVINAANGSVISSTSTAVSGPSGLSRIIAQSNAQNVTKKIYGGDMLGNLWRFDVTAAGSSKQLLATFQDSLGVAQPITARPQVTTLSGTSIVYVGTGRYLGTTDIGTTQQQTFYGVKDNIATTPYTGIRSDASFIKRTAVDGICPSGASIDICDPGTMVRTVAVNTGTAATDSLTSISKNGWFVDFPAGSGELGFTDPKLVLGTLAFSTSVPVASTSAVCGDPSFPQLPAFAYMLNYLDGGAVGTGTLDVIASTLGLGIATAPQIAQLPSGVVLEKFRLSSGVEVTRKQRFTSVPGSTSTKRISWRELLSK